MNQPVQPAVDRILTTLSEHLRASRRIGEIEALVGRSRGYFSKVAAGKWRISIDVLMRTLEVLEIEPEAFFQRAFGNPEADESSPPENPGPQVRNLAEVPDPPVSTVTFDWRR